MIGKINKMLDKWLLSPNLPTAQLILKPQLEDHLYLVQGLLQEDLLQQLHAEILKHKQRINSPNKASQQLKQKHQHKLLPHHRIFPKLHQSTTFSAG